MYEQDELKQLIGHKIDSISKTKDGELVKIIFDGETMYLVGEEDCHISTYWSSIEGKEAINDAIVTNVDLTDVIETNPEAEGEIYQAVIIETPKGQCKIETD